MSIDKMIDMLLLKYSNKYIMSITEIRQHNKDKNRISKSYIVNVKNRGNGYVGKNEQYRFYNKRELVSWLSCLE